MIDITHFTFTEMTKTDSGLDNIPDEFRKYE